MAIHLLTNPASVSFEAIINAIEAFNRSGQNPYGPNVPVITHRPLTLIIEGKGIEIEVEFYARDRSPEAAQFLREHPTFSTRHVVIYPMTRAMIQRQWHRVYAYDVLQETITDVKLLVGRKQDPDLFARHPAVSAWPWINDVKNSPEPLALE